MFDAVLADRLGVLADQVPFAPDDFPGYIAALFDHLVEHPELVRLTQWKFLERPTATEQERHSHQIKARQLAETLGVDDTRGMDALMLGLAMAQAWNTTSPGIRDLEQSHATRLLQHRAALVAAVSALTTATA